MSREDAAGDKLLCKNWMARKGIAETGDIRSVDAEKKERMNKKGGRNKN